MDPFQYKHNRIVVLIVLRCEGGNRDLWLNLQTNWQHFYWLTAKIPQTLMELVQQLEIKLPRQRGRRPSLDFKNQVLLTVIWMRKYPKLCYLSKEFNISISAACMTIHKILPLMHEYLVPNFIKWHTMYYWRSLAGDFPH